MSDGGGGESSRCIESSLKRRRRNCDFAQSIGRIAMAQVCESVGFQGFQQSALDTFSDIACKYIQDIGKLSKFYANLACRTEANVLDIAHALEDLGLSQGFVGASDIDHYLSGSGIIREISQYAHVSEDIGFAYSVPSFPVVRERDLPPSFLQAGEMPPTDDIPPWLPRFPDPNRYSSLYSASVELTETMPDRVEQNQVLEQSLLNLEQRLAYNGSELPFVFEQGDGDGRERESNPFLAVPLRSGEKEVSLVSLPPTLREEDVQNSLWANHVSTLEAIDPEVQAIKISKHDTKEGSRKVLLDSRPAVQLKFHVGINSLDTANIQKQKVNEEAMSWFVNEEARDNKKTKTEAIKRDYMDGGEHT